MNIFRSGSLCAIEFKVVHGDFVLHTCSFFIFEARKKLITMSRMSIASPARDEGPRYPHNITIATREKKNRIKLYY